MEQNPTSANAGSSLFIQKNSAAIRIWHWLTFLVVTALILTVLFASTTLNPRQNIPVVQNVLKEKGAVISNDQAFAVAHLFDDKMWNLHKLFGFALAFLFLARIGVELAQPRGEKIQTRMKNARLAYMQPGWDKKEARHYLLVRASYSLFYLLLFAMVATGLLIAFGGDWGISGQTRHSIKEIHGFIQYLIYAFLFFHLAGVVLAELGKSKGIVSGMINGGK